MKLLESKLVLDLQLDFETAFRIGSGTIGETMSDLGIVRTPAGDPYLPGSSLKGKLRVTAERLAPHLGLEACLLDATLSGVPCVSCQDWAKEEKEKEKERIKEVREIENTARRLEAIAGITCDVCALFGSPMRAARIFVSDGRVVEWAGVVQVRDGVVIDRDRETTVPHLKYDFETVPAGATFAFTIEAENLSEKERALLGAAIFEWQEGFTIGGGSSRGLGRAKLTRITARGIDFSNSEERRAYLLERKVPERNWEETFQKAIDEVLQKMNE